MARSELVRGNLHHCVTRADEPQYTPIANAATELVNMFPEDSLLLETILNHLSGCQDMIEQLLLDAKEGKD
jgi:hypothetical protein